MQPALVAETGPSVGPSASRRWVTWLVVSGLVASVLSGNSYRLGLPIAPDRVLLGAGLLLFFLTGLQREAGRLQWRPVHGLILAMIAWTTWSALDHGALASSYGAYALLDRIVMPFALFVLAPALFPTAAERRALMKALVALGLYLGATAVFEMLGLSALVFPTYVMDPDAGILFGRARGPFVNSEANGMVLAVCLFTSLLAVTVFRRAWRVAAVLAVPLTAVGILLTLTRSVWVGLALAIVLIGALVPPIRRRLGLLVAGSIAALVALLMSLPGLTDLIIERLTTERSVFDRQNTNAAALRAIAEHPVDGVGWVQFLDQAIDWVRQSDSYPVTNVDIEIHNVVLSRAAELGLVGAALWVGCILAGPALAVFRRVRDPELAGWRTVYIGFASVWAVCIMLSPVPYVLPNYLFWLLGGMVLRDHLLRPRPATVLAGSTTDRA